MYYESERWEPNDAVVVGWSATIESKMKVAISKKATYSRFSKIFDKLPWHQTSYLSQYARILM